MSSLAYLAAAFALLWAGAAVYLVRLAALRRSLERRIRAIEDWRGPGREIA